MNRYIGVILAFLAILSMAPRLIAETKGVSLVGPVLFLGWAVATVITSYVRANQPRNPEIPSTKPRRK